VEEFTGHNGGGEALDSTNETLMNAVAIIRAKGFYRSAKTAEEKGTVSTRGMVYENICLQHGTMEDKDKALWPSAKDAEEAKAVRAWAVNQGGDEFKDNIRTILSMDGIQERHKGLAVAAVWIWMKDTGTAPNYIPKARPCESSVWMGAVKDKITNVKATVAMLRTIDGDWGSSLLIKMVTETGNAVAWFCSGSCPTLNEGDVVMINRASIKSLNEFKGIKETQVTRAKITVLETAAVAAK
jgi:hypothetical protein